MFLQIVELKQNAAPSMANPHSHDYYELYFQLHGVNRSLFIKSEMYNLPSKTLCVIPPFCMHQLDGSCYHRININISKDLLSENEIEFLDDCAKKIALQLDDSFLALIEPLLMECARLYNSNDKKSKCYELPIVKTILHFLQKHNFQVVQSSVTTKTKETTDSLILKVVQYLNENYQSRIELKSLCDEFFLSKATLCARFKKTMNCSIMDYLLQVRLSKARDLILFSKHSIEKISEICGFSSVSYFRTSFKQIIGTSPLQYRKDIRGEPKKNKKSNK